MKKIIPIFCLFLVTYTFAQDNVNGTAELKELTLFEKNGKVFIAPEKTAIFSKGNDTFRKMISKNFRMRKVINSSNKESCEITFVIEADGSLTNVKAFGPNESFNNEAVRSVEKIKDKWFPAEVEGQKVSSKYRIPLTVKFD